MVGEDDLGVGGVSAEDLLGGRNVLGVLGVLVVVGEVPEDGLVLDERSDSALVHDS